MLVPLEPSAKYIVEAPLVEAFMLNVPLPEKSFIESCLSGESVPIPTFSELSIVIAVASELSEIPVLNKPLDIFECVNFRL